MEKSILLVDDEAGIRKVLGIALSDMGYQVYTAENGVEALRIFEDKRPPIVLTDIKMPEMDGIALTEALRVMIVPSSLRTKSKPLLPAGKSGTRMVQHIADLIPQPRFFQRGLHNVIQLGFVCGQSVDLGAIGDVIVDRFRKWIRLLKRKATAIGRFP